LEENLQDLRKCKQMDPGEVVMRLKINVRFRICRRDDMVASVAIEADTGLVCVIMSSLYVEKLTW
jgi:hypothetical protein